jgi:hypothetical protein
MDNKAYEKYKQDNPDVYTPPSTYDYVDQFVDRLTPIEIGVCVVAVILAVFAVYKIFVKRQETPPDNSTETRKEDQ